MKPDLEYRLRCSQRICVDTREQAEHFSGSD